MEWLQKQEQGHYQEDRQTPRHDDDRYNTTVSESKVCPSPSDFKDGRTNTFPLVLNPTNEMGLPLFAPPHSEEEPLMCNFAWYLNQIRILCHYLGLCEW